MADLQTALDDCLQALAQGEPRANCLEKYPAHAAELAKLLDSAAQIEAAREVAVPLEGRRRIGRRLQAHVRAHPRKPPRRGWYVLSTRPALAFGLALVLLVSVTTATAQAALPGNVLYPVKLASEQVWRVFQPDGVGADLNRAERRVREMERVANDRDRVEQAGNAYVSVVENVVEHLATVESQGEEQKKQEVAAERARIEQALREHKERLKRAGVTLAELDRILESRNDPLPSPPEAPPGGPPQRPTPGERPPRRPGTRPPHPSRGGGPP